jgi:hypothetical protein
MSAIDAILASLYDMEGRDLYRLGFALAQFNLDTFEDAANDD